MYRRIRELREDNDLTQTYMAKLLNVNQRTYSRYETGEHEISLASLSKIADFYNVSTDYLLDRTDIKKPYPKSKLPKS
ncbi:helix-turn-helix domain-containing protein [Roseburia sp. 1XD42-69]|jgi:Predicted transcriptional regulators|uniref:helix-turn-helix domain-containing protein n=1 Tax=Roseburia sp. 1XD42-69 TaxID=2320088 RepID=UPI000EA26AA3|nr:helix-turn-helix transcriptional regulator [Roseburia sp. 1XD42-69]RKJ60809.1 XRE family transcriptional regulator [Roseburia sp. 1XD42-69]